MLCSSVDLPDGLGWWLVILGLEQDARNKGLAAYMTGKRERPGDEDGIS